MRTRDELWSVPLNERTSVFASLTEEEIRELAKGYAVTAEAVADYLQLEYTDFDGVSTTYKERMAHYSEAFKNFGTAKIEGKE